MHLLDSGKDKRLINNCDKILLRSYNCDKILFKINNRDKIIFRINNCDNIIFPTQLTLISS